MTINNYKIKFSKTIFDVGLTKSCLKIFIYFSSLKALHAVVRKKDGKTVSLMWLLAESPGS